MKKLAVAATALALIATTLTAAPANAAATPAHQAKYGLECAKLKDVAAKKGADGSNLVCKVETAGTYKGKRIWAYPEYPTIKEMDLYMAGGAGGGGCQAAVTRRSRGKRDPAGNSAMMER